MQENTRPATEALTELLAGLGFGADRLDAGTELAIDRFDQWTNPRHAMLVPSSTSNLNDVDVELVRAA